MNTVLKIEDVEELELITHVPRAAITAEVLQGIQSLNETTELEPFLREILADATVTPHTSTEIADILTQLTIRGKSVRTAFVNKGKSYQKVTSREVAHQIVRLRQIEDLGLILLVATGHIQDDAKRDLFQTAADANAEALVVDSTDLARLLIAHHKICPKDGSPYRNGICGKCGRVANEPIELTIRVFEEPRYVILDQDDNSAFLKRYTANVMTDPHYPKATIREVIATATNELRRSRFTRSDLVQNAFGDRDADCVWLFVYLDLRDKQQTNWICRSLWISPDAPKDLCPMPLNGQEFLGEIEIDWNKDYFSMRQFWSEHLGNKAGWLEKTRALLPEVERLEHLAQDLLAKLEDGHLSSAAYTNEMTRLEQEASELFRASGNSDWPPLECEEADSRFRSMTSYLHNAYVPFASWGKADWAWDNKIWLVKSALKNFSSARDDFRYEWRKLGRSWG